MKDEVENKLMKIEMQSHDGNCLFFSVDSKRSQVRTIEVRPMAQQAPKQLTATVMPTTSQSEPQELIVVSTEGESFYYNCQLHHMKVFKFKYR